MVSGKPASSAAVSVSLWAAASNDAGTVTVISWLSNSKSAPALANRLFHAPLRWPRISAEARTGEILLLRAMSSDAKGRNGAERSDVWWQPGLRGMDDPARRFSGLFSREPADNPFFVAGLPAVNLGGDCFVRQIEKGRERWGFRYPG